MTLQLSNETGIVANFRALSDRLPGSIVLPGEEGWDSARQSWNLAVDQRPAAVALPDSAEDVLAVVELARAHGLQVAPQGTGHGALPLGPLHGTILLSTARMRGAQIDPVRRCARVQAGELWGEVATAAAEHGLTGLAGSSPHVGVVGYSIGGGIGWLARRYGLAANSILAADVVSADGRFIHTAREHEPDLFWAIRGGGGSFGIVTALELTLYPVREVYAGVLLWPIERAGEILRAWRDWIDVVPDEVTSIGRLRKMPQTMEVPRSLQGRSFVMVEAAYVGAEADGVELLRPLRALGPEIDTFALVPMTGLGPLHMDSQQPMPRIGGGSLLADFPVAAVDALVSAAGSGSRSPLGSVEVRHLGGALASRSPDHGALASLDAGFALYAFGMARTPEMGATIERHIDLVLEALAPWGADRNYLNFAERRVDSSDLYPAETLERLRRVKTHYDPEDLIRSNHPIKTLLPNFHTAKERNS